MTSLFAEWEQVLTLTIVPRGYVNEYHADMLKNLFEQYNWLRFDGSMAFGCCASSMCPLSMQTYGHTREMIAQSQQHMILEYLAMREGTLQEFYSLTACTGSSAQNHSSTKNLSTEKKPVKRRFRIKTTPQRSMQLKVPADSYSQQTTMLTSLQRSQIFEERQHVQQERHGNGMGHSLETKKKVTLCTTCGRWEENKMQPKLRELCQTPTECGQRALRRWKKNQHPDPRKNWSAS